MKEINIRFLVGSSIKRISILGWKWLKPLPDAEWILSPGLKPRATTFSFKKVGNRQMQSGHDRTSTAQFNNIILVCLAVKKITM